MVLKCPKCGQLLSSDPGDVGTCPKCKTKVVFPQKSPETKAEDHAGMKERKYKRDKEPGEGGGVLIALSIIFFVGAAFFLYQVYDKISNYNNSDFSSLNVNAYVGGDAYNYIINGTYSTTYAVIALVFIVCAFGCLILREIKRK